MPIDNRYSITGPFNIMTQICPVFEDLQISGIQILDVHVFDFRTTLNHLNTGLVQYSDVHCINKYDYRRLNVKSSEWENFSNAKKEQRNKYAQPSIYNLYFPKMYNIKKVLR
jgi:hypothetical protein